MRILLISAESTDALARAIGSSINADMLHENTLDANAHTKAKRLLIVSKAQTEQQASQLADRLTAFDIELDLVLHIDTDSATPSVPVERTASQAADFFAAKNMLRRIRGDAEMSDILAAAERIIDDTQQASQSGSADAFTEALQLAAQKAPPEKVASTLPEANLPQPSADFAHPIESPHQSAQKTSSWKRSAEQKGKLRRKSTGSKGKNISRQKN